MSGKILGELMGMWVIDCLGMIHIVPTIYADYTMKIKIDFFASNRVGEIVYFNSKNVHISINRNDVPILASIVEGKK